MGSPVSHSGAPFSLSGSPFSLSGSRYTINALHTHTCSFTLSLWRQASQSFFWDGGGWEGVMEHMYAGAAFAGHADGDFPDSAGA